MVTMMRNQIKVTVAYFKIISACIAIVDWIIIAYPQSVNIYIYVFGLLA